MTDHLQMWTIYERPRDRPGPFTVRRYVIRPGEIDHCEAHDFPNLAAARESVPPGLVCRQREEDDDPCIVELWF